MKKGEDMENSQYVYVASPKVGGAVWSAPDGTTLPTDAVTDLPTAFECLGYISEDGIVNAVETDTEEIKAYGGKVVKTVQSSRKETFTFTPIETNKVVLAEQYGDDNVTIDKDGNLTVKHNAFARPSRVYVIETLLDNNRVSRDVIPFGRITNVGEKTYASGSAVASEIEITCEEDSSGNTAYTYIATIVDDSVPEVGNGGNEQDNQPVQEGDN